MIHNRTPERMSDDRILRFLKAMSSLTWFCGPICSIEDTRLIESIATRPNLEVVSFDGSFPDVQMESLLSTPCSTMFAALRVLIINNTAQAISGSVLRSLLDHSQHLQSLYLTNVGPIDTIERALEAPNRISHLSLTLSSAHELHDFDLRSVVNIGRACPYLQDLAIEALALRPLHYSLSESQFLEIAQSLPCVESVKLPIILDAKAMHFRTMSKYWPRLHSLTVSEFNPDLDDLSSSAKDISHHLLRLQDFNLGTTSLFRDSSVQIKLAVEILNELMPSLADVTFDRADDIQDAAFRQWTVTLERRTPGLPRTTIQAGMLKRIFDSNLHSAARDAQQKVRPTT